MEIVNCHYIFIVRRAQVEINNWVTLTQDEVGLGTCGECNRRRLGEEHAQIYLDIQSHGKFVDQQFYGKRHMLQSVAVSFFASVVRPSVQSPLTLTSTHRQVKSIQKKGTIRVSRNNNIFVALKLQHVVRKKKNKKEQDSSSSPPVTLRISGACEFVQKNWRPSQRRQSVLEAINQ